METKKVSQQILGFGSPNNVLKEESDKNLSVSSSSSTDGLKELSPLKPDDVQKLYNEEKGFHMYTPKKASKILEEKPERYGSSKKKGKFAKGAKRFIKSVLGFGAVVVTLFAVQSLLPTGKD